LPATANAICIKRIVNLPVWLEVFLLGLVLVLEILGVGFFHFEFPIGFVTFPNCLVPLSS
jgi:hypothetical protein